MKKAGFIGSIVSVLLGAMAIVTMNVINEIMPKIGYMEFKKLLSGSYSTSDYVMNFTCANTVAIILIAGGLIFGTYCFISENRTK